MKTTTAFECNSHNSYYKTLMPNTDPKLQAKKRVLALCGVFSRRTEYGESLSTAAHLGRLLVLPQKDLFTLQISHPHI